MLPQKSERLRIVLVENDDNDVFFVERALRKAGFDVALERLIDGQQALDYFSRLEPARRPDLVLLDVQMPRRNGFEVLEWMRRQPAYHTLPIMMLTSSDDPVDSRRAEALGADDFLTKQANCQDVIEMLKRFRN